MKILFPMVTFYKTGGMRVLTQIANEFFQNGNTVDVVVSDDSKPYFPFDSGINIIKLNKKNVISGLFSMSKYIMQHGNYDVIIANQYRTSYYVFWGTLLNKNISKYYYVQAYEVDFYSRKSIKQNLMRINAWFSYYLPLIQIVNSDIYKNYKNVHSTRVVYPGMDLKKYYSKDITFFNKVIKIGTIGRMDEIKGTKDVCRAMEILESDGIEFEFYIAFNDFDTIPHHFVKPDGDDKLSEFYRDMDIVVAACKGQHGAIHYPIIETMAVGSTIVCTDYYPSNDHNAYKVDESSPEQIAESIKQIICNKQEAIKKRKQALMDVQQFDWPIVAQKFYNYLQEGCDNK